MDSKEDYIEDVQTFHGDVTDIVLVHGAKPPSPRKKINPRCVSQCSSRSLGPRAKSGYRKLHHKMQVKQKQVVVDGEEVDEAIKDWISGGTFGSKAAVLVFRSCVLASPTTSSTSTAKQTPSDGNAILLSKAKIMAKRLTSTPEPQPFNVISKNIMHNVMETFGNTQKYESNAYVVKHISEDDLEIDEPEMNGQKPRDINAVLNDLNKVKLKKLNVINTTANIKLGLNNDDSRTSEEILITEESQSTESPYQNSTEVHINAENVISLLKNDMDTLKVLESNKMPANLLHVTYKLVNTETRLLHKLLKAHGLCEEVADSNDSNLLWSGLHFKPDLLRSLSSYQRVNHFPRSYELTRKDRLFKNIEKMAYFRGAKHFDFIPTTFLMPREYKELCSAHYRTKGPWIVKPAASSRGRGIYIVNTPEQIPKGDNVVVAKYIDKPLLVGGHKCDLRLYVCVTSIDPLLIYLYEEGLVRIATVKYDNSHKNLWNPCMHLCNYSINKYHTDYIKCDDPKAGDVGHKWTLSALLRQLRSAGRNTQELMAAIEDLIIKSILSSAQTITAASRVFVPHFNNCFELFGYDILVDDALKPWLLEINLSPSLGCDTALDARVKSALLADTLTLVGVPAVPASGTPSAAQQAACKTVNLKARIGACKRVHSAENMNSSVGGRKGSTLTGEEARMVRHTRAQYERRGGYVRIFPSQNSWQKYSQYLDPVTGVPVCTTSVMSGGVPYSPVALHNYNLLLHEHLLPPGRHSDLPQRLQRYERVEVSSAAPAVQLSEGIGVEAGAALSPDRRRAKQTVKQQLTQGLKLTPGEGRRAFGLFLNYVLKRISNPINDTAVQHADFVLKFLRKASFSLRMPFDVKVPPAKMCDKDRCAVIAKQLNDFLYMFYRDTDLCTDATDQPGCVANIHFAQFMYGASEADLEDVLLLALSYESDPRALLGETRGPLCIDVPVASGTSTPGTPTSGTPADTPGPHAHVLLRQLARIAPPKRISPSTSVTRASS